MISFFAEGIPRPQGNHRATRQGRIYESTKGHKEWRAIVENAARDAMGGRKRFTGPCSAELIFYFKRPKSHMTKLGNLRKGMPIEMIQSPDLDKITRAIFDSLTDAEVWKDDKQCNMMICSKIYISPSCQEGVAVKVIEL